MKYPAVLLWLVLQASFVGAQAQTNDPIALQEAAERERIQRERASEQPKFAALEAQCYSRFAVNDCLAEVRSQRREVFGNLRRQEILLNDAQRKRRAAEQLLRSDERIQRLP